MTAYIYKFLLVLLYLVLAVVLLSTSVGIPGNWILVAIAFIIALATHFTGLTWFYLALCLALAILGEVVEALLGTAVVAGKGGGRYGVIGTFVGGIAGAVLGAPYFIPVGSIVFGMAGAFAGAVAGEYIRYRSLDEAMRIGFWAFVGRVMAMFVKLGLGCGILFVIIWRTWQ